MAGYRYWLHCSLSIVLGSMFVGAGHAQFKPIPQGTISGELVGSAAPISSTPTCKVYSLAELGDDPKLCKWIAETIPDVIQPASWKQDGVKITYYAPGKVMVINHSAAVHAQVDSFLQEMKKSMPQAKAASGVVPAQFTVPDNRPVQASQAYPVPYPPHAPKHLFHFIIRYEGEGVIDSNVVKFTKAMNPDAKGAPSCLPPPSAPPAPPVVGVSESTNWPVNVQPAPRPMMPPADGPGPLPFSTSPMPAPLPRSLPSTLPPTTVPPLVPVPF